MNIKHLFFYMLLIAFSSCSKPGYEKAIAEWVHNVTDCKYSVMRHHNCYFPDSDAWCGNVEVTVIAPGKEDLELFEWYSDLQVLSGCLVFDLSSQLAYEYTPQKTLYFEDARCFSLTEDYHIDQKRRRLLRLEFAAEKMTIDTISFISNNNI